MRTIIHISQSAIKRNKDTGSNEPVILCRSDKSHRLGHHVSIKDANGNVVAEILYRPDAPLKSGASVWIETELNVVVTRDDVDPEK